MNHRLNALDKVLLTMASAVMVCWFLGSYKTDPPAYLALYLFSSGVQVFTCIKLWKSE